MTKLDDVLDTTMLDEHIKNKYVRSQVHPDFPELMILNYTESCTWDKAWDHVTLACRGLIVNTETGEVLARPFTKFFNHNQEGAPVLTLETPVVVTEKMDGSMGILYKTPDGAWAIATRGSFASDQAMWATKYYNENYANKWAPDETFTYIFEIIYPENRIVVDYGDKEGLVLLGVVTKETGQTYQPYEGEHFGWPGEVVETHEFMTYGEVIASDQRANKEGFVLWRPTEDWRVKIKHDEYMVLHRFMTQINERHVWELLATKSDYVSVFAAAPDEFHQWLNDVVIRLQLEHSKIVTEANDTFSRVMSTLGSVPLRKEFADTVKDLPNKALLFKLLDNFDIDEIVWKLVRPVSVGSVRHVDISAD
jgi:RNA ligase